MVVNKLKGVHPLSKLVWLDYFDYAIRLFSNGKHDYVKKPDSFISIVSQGQALLKSDIVNVNIECFYIEYINENKELVQKWAEKKLGFAVKKLLASTEPKEIITEVLKGLSFLYEHSKPLVLIIPSPKSWVKMVLNSLENGINHKVEQDQIEAVAMYQAEWLRGFSKAGLSGIVIKEEVNLEYEIDHHLEFYQPILNISDHYQWSTGIYVSEFSGELLKFHEKFDFTLFSRNSKSDFIPLWEKEEPIFGGLNREFWQGEEEAAAVPSNALYFGKIPPDTEPETVLVQLKKIRS
ncbi:hypothetical protein [Peribacillus tepidiphilus]|uniref:hypothetical protein n=1 Tax=Peribacillus tepidiphilus TaxID=2652445 RepID=UPI0035B51DF9